MENLDEGLLSFGIKGFEYFNKKAFSLIEEIQYKMFIQYLKKMDDNIKIS